MRPCRAAINSHTRSRILSRATVIRASAAWSISFSERHIVGIDATGPNTRGWSRRTRASEMQSVPSAIATAMSRSTAPRSWITSGRDTAADSASLNPVASASIRVIALPACCATSSPRTSTRRFFDHSVIACICQVRLPLDYQVVEKPDYP